MSARRVLVPVLVPALALLAAAGTAHASGELLPDEGLPRIESAGTICDIIVWIAGTFGPNIPQAARDADEPQALCNDGTGAVYHHVASLGPVSEEGLEAARLAVADHANLDVGSLNSWSACAPAAPLMAGTLRTRFTLSPARPACLTSDCDLWDQARPTVLVEIYEDGVEFYALVD